MKRKLPPELDVTSEYFNPEKALKFDIPLPFPKAKTYDNIADWYNHTFGKKNSVSQNESRASTKNDVFVLKRNFKWYYDTLGLSLPRNFNEKEQYKRAFKRKRNVYGKFKPVNVKEVDPQYLDPMRSSKIIVKRPDGSLVKYIYTNNENIISSKEKIKSEVNQLSATKDVHVTKKCENNAKTSAFSTSVPQIEVIYNKQKELPQVENSSTTLPFIHSILKNSNKLSVLSNSSNLNSISMSASQHYFSSSEKMKEFLLKSIASIPNGDFKSPGKLFLSKNSNCYLKPISSESDSDEKFDCEINNRSNFEVEPNVSVSMNSILNAKNDFDKSSKDKYSQSTALQSSSENINNMKNSMTMINTSSICYNHCKDDNTLSSIHKDKYCINVDETYETNDKFLDVKVNYVDNSAIRRTIDDNQSVKISKDYISVCDFDNYSNLEKDSSSSISEKTAKDKRKEFNEQSIINCTLDESLQLLKNDKIDTENSKSSVSNSDHKLNLSNKNSNKPFNMNVNFCNTEKSPKKKTVSNEVSNKVNDFIAACGINKSSFETKDSLPAKSAEIKISKCDKRSTEEKLSEEKTIYSEPNIKEKTVEASKSLGSTSNLLHKPCSSNIYSDIRFNTISPKRCTTEKINSNKNSVEKADRTCNLSKVDDSLCVIFANSSENKTSKCNKKLTEKNISKRKTVEPDCRRKSLEVLTSSNSSFIPSFPSSDKKYEILPIKALNINEKYDHKEEAVCEQMPDKQSNEIKIKSSSPDFNHNLNCKVKARLSNNSNNSAKTTTCKRGKNSSSKNTFKEIPPISVSDSKKNSTKRSSHSGSKDDLNHKCDQNQGRSKEKDLSKETPENKINEDVPLNSFNKSGMFHDSKQNCNNLTPNTLSQKMCLKTSIDLKLLKGASEKRENVKEKKVFEPSADTKYTQAENIPHKNNSILEVLSNSKSNIIKKKECVKQKTAKRKENQRKSEDLLDNLLEANSQNKQDEKKSKASTIPSNNRLFFEESSINKQAIDNRNIAAHSMNENNFNKCITSSLAQNDSISYEENDDLPEVKNSNELQKKYSSTKPLSNKKSVLKNSLKNENNLINSDDPESFSKSLIVSDDTVICEKKETLFDKNINKSLNTQEKKSDVISTIQENDLYGKGNDRNQLELSPIKSTLKNKHKIKHSVDKKNNFKKLKVSSEGPSLDLNSDYKIQFGETNGNRNRFKLSENSASHLSLPKSTTDTDCDKASIVKNKKQEGENEPFIVVKSSSNSESSIKETSMTITDSVANRKNIELACDASSVLKSVENNNYDVNKRRNCLETIDLSRKNCSETSVEVIDLSSDSDDTSKEIILLDLARKARNKIHKMK